MIEVGTVKELKKDRAVVVFDRKSACDRCRMCAVSKGNGMKVEILIKNTLNKQPGDSVCVEMGDKYVLTAAAIVYIIPVLLVTAGLLLGTLWGELWQIILAAVGFAGGFGVAVLFDRILRKRKGFTPVMTETSDVETPQSDLNGQEIKPQEGEQTDE